MSRRPGVVHLGVGAFARAHLAWYTQHAGAPSESDVPWGIVAFSGRSPAAADALTAQDCRYTLVTRAADGDTAELIDVIVAAHAGSDSDAWRTALASPDTAVVTLTVTENGYADDADVGARLVDGLTARRDVGSGPVALVSLDNLTGNGDRLRALVRAAADPDPDLVRWIDANVTFPSSMVDRITPATTDADVDAVAHLDGALPGDRIPVVTEPFAEWVLEDAFPAGRPAWDTAGARIVDDVTPYEQRKLWLLNGAHSLLAYLGQLLGHETVADAIGDPVCLTAVEQLWDEAAAELALPADDIAVARADLLDRFRNPRIRHTLRQIGADGSKKLPVRIIEPLRHRLARDASAGIGPGAATALAAWWSHCTTQPDRVADAGAVGADSDVHDVLAVVAPELDTTAVAAAVTAAADRIRSTADARAVPTSEGAPA